MDESNDDEQTFDVLIAYATTAIECQRRVEVAGSCTCLAS